MNQVAGSDTTKEPTNIFDLGAEYDEHLKNPEGKTVQIDPNSLALTVTNDGSSPAQDDKNLVTLIQDGQILPDEAVKSQMDALGFVSPVVSPSGGITESSQKISELPREVSADKTKPPAEILVAAAVSKFDEVFAKHEDDPVAATKELKAGLDESLKKGEISKASHDKQHEILDEAKGDPDKYASLMQKNSEFLVKADQDIKAMNDLRMLFSDNGIDLKGGGGLLTVFSIVMKMTDPKFVEAMNDKLKDMGQKFAEKLEENQNGTTTAASADEGASWKSDELVAAEAEAKQAMRNLEDLRGSENPDQDKIAEAQLKYDDAMAKVGEKMAEDAPASKGNGLSSATVVSGTEDSTKKVQPEQDINGGQGGLNGLNGSPWTASAQLGSADLTDVNGAMHQGTPLISAAYNGSADPVSFSLVDALKAPEVQVSYVPPTVEQDELYKPTEVQEDAMRTSF